MLVIDRRQLVWPVKAENAAAAGEPASARWRVTGVALAPRLVEVEGTQVAKRGGPYINVQFKFSSCFIF